VTFQLKTIIGGALIGSLLYISFLLVLVFGYLSAVNENFFNSFDDLMLLLLSAFIVFFLVIGSGFIAATFSFHNNYKMSFIYGMLMGVILYLPSYLMNFWNSPLSALWDYILPLIGAFLAVVISNIHKTNSISVAMSGRKKAIGIALTIFLIVIYIFFSGQTFTAPLVTTYSSGFSYEKFYKIQVGSSKDDVYQILGKPFSRADDKIPCDSYSRANSEWSDFLGWISVGICYDKKGKVNQLSRNVFFN